MRKFSFLALLALSTLGAKAQMGNYGNQPTADKYRVVTNPFWSNWFITAGGGVNVMYSDYDNKVDFGKRINGDYYVGLGKWFTPSFGLMVQAQGLQAKGALDEVNKGHYTQTGIIDDKPGFYKQTVKYNNFAGMALFNLNNLFGGYKDEVRKSNFVLGLGAGLVRHRGVEDSNDRELSLNAELKYSYKIIPALSVDLKAYGLFAQTDFDGVVEQRSWDCIGGLGLGLTYNIGQGGWERCSNGCDCDEIDRLRRELEDCKSSVRTPRERPTQNRNQATKTAEFYIFYPNNYSGRNDAPIVGGSDVNTIDYLVSGIFTQKKFNDQAAAERAMGSDARMARLSTSDVNTEKGSQAKSINVTRGYEMAKAPISLSTDAKSMAEFERANGYVYAPIYAEKDYPTKKSRTNKWNYRIDEVNKGQVLLDEGNYTDGRSYQLNAHSGLSTLQSRLNTSSDTQLFSFADVYAAIEGNTGYISQFADPQAVNAFTKILSSGRVKRIIITGVATSQDNQTMNVDPTRNTTLANNRANSAANWLKKSGLFRGVEFVINAGTDTFGSVNTGSVNDLIAKLNRSAKIQIVYADSAR